MCFDIFHTLFELPTPTSQKNIKDYTGTTRQTTSKHLSTLRNRGLIKSHRAGIEPTAGGKVLLKTIKDFLRETENGDGDRDGNGDGINKKPFSKDELAYLTRSEHPLGILLELSKTPRGPKELESTATSPSRSTVNRIIEQTVSYGWIKDETGRLRITPLGEDVLVAYAELAIVVEQLIKKAAWLQRLPVTDATFPVEALADATVITAKTGSFSAVLWKALKLCDLRISRFRCICSIYDPILFFTYQAMLKVGIDAESVLDWSTYVKIRRHHETHFAADETAYTNYQPQYLEKSHTLGVGLYDSRKVAVGAYNERGAGKTISMIVSTNDELVEWGEQLYESYRKIAHRPGKEPSVAATDSSSIV